MTYKKATSCEWRQTEARMPLVLTVFHSYNALPEDSKQPEISDVHILNFAEIFTPNKAHTQFGIHLIHRHFDIPLNIVMLGETLQHLYCRWIRATSFQDLDGISVGGHIFALAKDGWHSCEYHQHPMPDLSNIGGSFFWEVCEYTIKNDLSDLVGRQFLYATDPGNDGETMLELLLHQAPVVFRHSDLIGCSPARQTGWKFKLEHGEPRVCQNNETHGKLPTGEHMINNKGRLGPVLQSYQYLKNEFAVLGVLRAWVDLEDNNRWVCVTLHGFFIKWSVFETLFLKKNNFEGVRSWEILWFALNIDPLIGRGLRCRIGVRRGRVLEACL
jgi:hypothetical protein